MGERSCPTSLPRDCKPRRAAGSRRSERGGPVGWHSTAATGGPPGDARGFRRAPPGVDACPGARGWGAPGCRGLASLPLAQRCPQQRSWRSAQSGLGHPGRCRDARSPCPGASAAHAGALPAELRGVLLRGAGGMQMAVRRAPGGAEPAGRAPTGPTTSGRGGEEPLVMTGSPRPFSPARSSDAVPCGICASGRACSPRLPCACAAGRVPRVPCPADAARSDRPPSCFGCRTPKRGLLGVWRAVLFSFCARCG